MNTVTQPPEPITPAWLTDVLRAAGALQQGAVTAAQELPTDAFNSRTRHLALSYDAGASGDCPTRLILKQPIDADWAREAGADEVRFYQLAATLDSPPPAIVPCYGAALDEASGDTYLLLLDVSATHAHPVAREQQIGLSESVPPDDAIRQVVEALARHHACWWDHPLLHAGRFAVGYWSRDAERFQLYQEHRRAAWDGFWLATAACFPPTSASATTVSSTGSRGTGHRRSRRAFARGPT